MKERSFMDSKVRSTSEHEGIPLFCYIALAEIGKEIFYKKFVKEK